jgi:hypothetical protein
MNTSVVAIHFRSIENIHQIRPCAKDTLVCKRLDKNQEVHNSDTLSQFQTGIKNIKGHNVKRVKRLKHLQKYAIYSCDCNS